MEKVKIFDTWDAYEAWAESFEGSYEYQTIPSAIVTSNGYRIDLMTEGKASVIPV